MAVAAPPPIPGTSMDPPPKAPPALVGTLEAKTAVAGVAYRAFTRFSFSRASLLAAGTAYYLFLSLFALLGFAYGLTAAIGAERISVLLTEALQEALPGLVGEDGIDPETLRRVGQTSSIIGLVTLLYSGSAAIVAASASMHLIYGAPPDGRNFFKARLRLISWTLLFGPLIALSFVVANVVRAFGTEINEALGLGPDASRTGLTLATVVLTYLLDVFIIWLLLGVLGGIRPERTPRLLGAAVGAVAVVALTYLAGAIVAWSVSKPQYGALAVPIATLLILFLQTMALYGSAALTAGYADRNRPLEDLTPGDGSESSLSR